MYLPHGVILAQRVPPPALAKSLPLLPLHLSIHSAGLHLAFMEDRLHQSEETVQDAEQAVQLLQPHQ